MPISAFHNALRAFRSGRLGFDDLSAEIDRQLTVERVSAAVLLDILTLHQSSAPLPVDTHATIARQILEWPEDPTIVTGPRREAAAGHTVEVGVGDILQGRFSLAALAGEGGMSRVYKAIDLRRVEAGGCDPYVAVKVLKKCAAMNVGSVATLMHEVHKLQGLDHPNIVRVMDCGRDGRAVFMTMEYLPGQSLRKILRDCPNGMTQSDAFATLSGIGAALEHAHRNRIVHGDLKPGNVIVTEDGSVKVIDFGVSNVMGRADEVAADAADAARPAAFTPRYASPELVAGGEPVPADDVYALACIAYEALCGSHPAGHPGNGAPKAHPPRPAGMPRHQYLAIVRGLAAERDKRTGSVRQFLDELAPAARTATPPRWAGYAAAAILLTAALYFAHPRQTASRAAASVDSAAGPAPMGSVLRDCPACPAMRVLPAGRFVQGAPGAAVDASSFERPRHPVSIGHSLAMSSNEVTVGEYRQFVAATHREASGCAVYEGRWEFRATAGWQNPGFAQTELHPATCISWDDAVAYADWLSARTGRRYRLPSSSEWEYAARAGAEAPPSGLGAQACAAANVADRSAARRFPGWDVFPCDDAYVNTAPVGTFPANAFGLTDMLGNVFEWVQDCWHDDYTGAPDDGGARVEPGCAERELRGGSWFSAPQYVSPTYRNRFEHAYRSSSTGFRVVRDLGQ